MRHILVKTSEKYFSNEADNQKLGQYDRLKEQPGWVFHLESLTYMQGLILQELMSDSFTSLNKEEKDVKQRTLKGIYDVIEFLKDPARGSLTLRRIKQHNKDLDAKRRI